MHERVFTRDHGRYRRGRRLTLRSLAEWASWFPGFEKFTAAVEDLVSQAMPARLGRPPKRSNA